MELRVLGPLEVGGPSGAVPVGGPVPRRVLTALLARAGTALPVDSLVDAAWGDEPPPSAERTLQSHVARLRDALAGSGGTAPRLERTDTGYVLTIGDATLDVDRFEALLARAAVGTPSEAVADLREALSLWRTSTPYADLQDTAYPAAQAARLVELRGSAGESLVSAELDAGDASTAASDVESLLTDDPYRERLWELLITALYRQGRQGDALAAYGRAAQALDEGLGLEPGPRLRELQRQVLAQDPALSGRAQQSMRPCPYKGLARYDVDDVELYVGRERLVDEIVARLVDARFLVLVGPSGAGKSSLVRAGLLPALRAGALPGSAAWSVAVVTPGADPIAAIESAHGIDLLVVDQAEEALLAGEGAHALAFGDGVLAAVERGTRVVLALRADFFGRLAEHPVLARRAGPATVLVGPPDDAELRRIVVEPAARVGLVVSDALADRVVAEVRGRPGVLPVLSTALVRTWEHREGDQLTLESYRAGGGVEAALQRVGEEAWSALESDDERAACRRILMRLAVEEDGSWVRRRVRLADVASPADRAAVAALAVLTDRRLVVARADDIEITHETLLAGWPRLRDWLEEGRAFAEVRERLAVVATAWAASDHDPTELYAGTRLQAALDAAAASPDDLTALEREFLATSSAQADSELREQRARADREASGRRRTRAVAAGLAVALAVAGVAGGFAVVKQRDAVAAATTSDRVALAADANRLGTLARTGGEYDLSLLLAAQAVALDPTSSSEGDLFATLIRSDAATAVQRAPGVLEDLTFSDDGRSLVGITTDGHLVTWAVGGGASSSDVDLDDYGVQRHIQALPDGTVAVGRADQLVIADPRTGTVSRELRATPGLWAFDPGRRALVAGALDEQGQYLDQAIWADDPSNVKEIATGAKVVGVTRCGDAACVTTEAGRLLRLSFADGHVEASYDLPALARADTLVGEPTTDLGAYGSVDGSIHVIDTRTGRSRQVLSGGNQDPEPLALSPDGTRLVTRDHDVVLLWNVGTLDIPQRLVGHTGSVEVARFSADGSTLVTTGSDKTLITWDLTGSKRLGRVLTRGLTEDTSTLWPIGVQAAIGQFGGTLRFVDLASGAVTATTGANPFEGAVALETARSGGSGTLLVVTDEQGRTAVWDTASRRWTGSVDLGPVVDPYAGYAWVSPDGRSAATIRRSDGPVVFDLETRKVLRQLPPLPAGSKPEAVVAVQGWSGDGTALLITRVMQGAADLVVVDATTGAVRFIVDLNNRQPEEVVADPTGRFLAVALATGEVAIADAHDGHALVADVAAIPGDVFNVSVSPDGRYLSASGQPPQVTVWDTRDFRQVGTALPLDVGARDARARFAADGSLVVVSGRTVRSYVIDPTAWLARACATAGRVLTRDEWDRYLPGRPYAPACTPAASG